jgi:hypothetical protein
MRTNPFSRTVAALLVAAFTLTAQAEEKNGLLVSVSKKTLDRNDTKGIYSGRIDRIQGLMLSVKNTSIRDFPEGEVQWTIVVRKALAGGLEKYSGKETLKTLRPSSSAELVLGAAQTGGYRAGYYYTYNYKDKLEYEVVIVHDGKETLRTSSDANFAALSKRAISMDTPAAAVPDPAAPLVAPLPAVPGVPVVPPAPTPPTPPAPAPAPATKPVAPNPAPAAPDPAPAPDPNAKPFDFFNLDRKKAK